jgi:predicted flap endonuclease-1-like 5' DNA nuclease
VLFRKKLTEAESTAAFVVGGGLTLFIIGFLLASARSALPNPTNTGGRGSIDFVMVVGALLFVAGVAGWLVITRPWKNFDDWSTPHYTGHPHHEEHSDHDEHGEHTTHSETAAEGHAAVSHVARSAPIPSAASVAKASTATSGTDDLKVIEGIGPKIATALNGVGIRTFADLAERNPDDVERIVRDAGVRMVGHADTWIEQAKLASSGKTAELEALQKQLRSGSKPRRS